MPSAASSCAEEGVGKEGREAVSDVCVLVYQKKKSSGVTKVCVCARFLCVSSPAGVVRALPNYSTKRQLHSLARTMAAGTLSVGGRVDRTQPGGRSKIDAVKSIEFDPVKSSQSPSFAIVALSESKSA